MRKLHTNSLNSRRWMIVDNFAGGGGASTGIEMAIGRSPDVAINHDPEALAMHNANHPLTRHYASDVFEIDPRVVVRDRKVGLGWFSPDCTHHSKARGGKPIRETGKKSRGLAHVVVKWAKQVRPRVIIVENVEEFQQWGPLIQAEGGGFVPCPARKGRTFRAWVRALQRLGYSVEWKELRACDYGSPTIRKRLFVIARCDGKPIVWPVPTHGKPDSPEVVRGERKAWRTAAEIIDWSLPCPSIFLTREESREVGVNRPLAENTMKRIAAGLKRYVINNPNPFIVCCNHSSGAFRGQGLDVPAATVTGSKGDAFVVPFAVPRYSERDGQFPRSQSLQTPAATIVCTGNGTTIVAPVLQAYHGQSPNGEPARSSELSEPLRTQDTSNRYSVVSPVLTREFGNSNATSVELPAPTVMATGSGKTALVQAFLAQHNTGVVGHEATRPLTASRKDQTHLVKAFLEKYYGADTNHQVCDEPLHTVPTRDRFGVVTVDEVDSQIVDIGMRMLTSRELFRAQGFPDWYKIDVPAPNRHGMLRPLPKDAQVRMCGNSVCPQLAAALVAANCPWLRESKATMKRERQLEFADV